MERKMTHHHQHSMKGKKKTELEDGHYWTSRLIIKLHQLRQCGTDQRIAKYINRRECHINTKNLLTHPGGKHKLIQDLRENLGDFEFTDDCLDVQLTKEKTQYIKDKINRIKKAID